MTATVYYRATAKLAGARTFTVTIAVRRGAN